MVEIRHANIHDLDRLDELDKHITWDNMRKCIIDGRVSVVSIEKMIIGWLRYGLFYDMHPFLNLIYFLERYRGMGLGTKLMDEWEIEMHKLGYNIIFTSTQSDETAQHFYRKRGFTDLGEYALPEQEASELLLMKKLGDRNEK